MSLSPDLELIGEEIFESGKSVEMLSIYRSKLFAEALGLLPDERDLRTEFVQIPGGTFTMGVSDKEVARWSEWKQGKWRLGDSEEPAREVDVEPFLLARTPMTQGVWDGLEGLGFGVWDQRLVEGGELPVTSVSWDFVQEFLEDSTFRLPSEAEWEHACRAWTDTTFFFGSVEFTLAEYAWFKSGGVMEVGQKLPNPFGLHDMHGNVWEMCSDWWLEDDESQDSHQRVLRGGSFRQTIPSGLASAVRSYAGIHSHSDDVGFRLALTL